jgi:hypothetical protein
MRKVLFLIGLLSAAAQTAAFPPAKVPSSMTASEVEAYFSGAEPGKETLPAETFGFPHPERVLEWGDKLGLAPEQRARVEEVLKIMKTDASYYGRKIVTEELALDEYFRSGGKELAPLANRVEKIGYLKWKHRLAQFTAYLYTRLVLSPEQLEKYRALRVEAAAQTGNN